MISLDSYPKIIITQYENYASSKIEKKRVFSTICEDFFLPTVKLRSILHKRLVNAFPHIKTRNEFLIEIREKIDSKLEKLKRK